MKEVPNSSVRVYLALLHMQHFALLVLLALLTEAWDLLLEFCVYTHFAQKQRRLAHQVAEMAAVVFNGFAGTLD